MKKMLDLYGSVLQIMFFEKARCFACWLGETLKRIELRLGSWEKQSRGYEYEEIDFLTYALRRLRLKLQRKRRVIVPWGESGSSRWGVNLFFHSFFLVDAEIHSGWGVYRGPLYGMGYGREKGALVLKLNWVARRHVLFFGAFGSFFGAKDFLLQRCGGPKILPNKDILFFHNRGYVIIHSGSNERLSFGGNADTPRIYSFF